MLNYPLAVAKSMQSAGQVRRNLLAALVGVLIVFTAAFCVPLANLILTINNEFSSGVFLASPTLSFFPVFLLVLEGAFLVIVISLIYSIVSNFRSNRTDDFS